MESITAIMENLPRLWQRIFPCLVVEMVLPGGTLLALLLYLAKKHDISGRFRAARDELDN